MRWIVGLDLGGRSSGALQMVSWLGKHSAAHHEFVAVHVADVGSRDSAKMTSEAMEAVRSALGHGGPNVALPDGFVDAQIVLGTSIEGGLVDAACGQGIDGVILGRAAPRGGHRLVRLGSVARRMLRLLPVPVLVVPPGLEATAIGAGAVVVASDFSSTSNRAAALAQRIADELRRELVVVHVDPARDFGRDLTGEKTLLAAWSPPRTLDDIERWSRAQGLKARARLSQASIVEGLLEAADVEDAPLLVCGSRRLTLLDRIFASSTGSDLARFADRPVLVVPGD